MRRGTTQEKTTKLLKRFPCGSSRNGNPYDFDRRLSCETQEDFEILKDFVSRNEI